MDNNQQEQTNENMPQWDNYLHKYVKVRTVDGKEYEAYMDGFDGQQLYLLIPHKLRDDQNETEENDESRAFGYPGVGGGYPGYGYGGYPGYAHGGYPGYGYGGYPGYTHGGYPGHGYGGYPGYGHYGFGRFILPLAALGGLALL